MVPKANQPFQATGRRGFTLIELVVSMAIASMLLLMIASFSILTVRLNQSVDDYGTVQNLAKLYLQIIEGELRYADQLNIEATVPYEFNQNMRYLYLDDGTIMRQTPGSGANPIASPGGYPNFSCSMQFSPVNEKVVEVNLAIKKEGNILYSISSKIFINNLIYKSITGEQQGSCVSYGLSNIPVSAISVFSSYSTIDVLGETMQMSADVYPEDAGNKGVAWSVDDPDNARISQEGVLTPLKNGTVVVTATALDGSGVSGAKQIIIRNQEIIMKTLKFSNQNKKQMQVGKQLTLIVDISPDNASNQQLEWSVDDSSLASISQDGVLTAGYTHNKSVVVTARSKDGSGLSDTIEIKIKK